MQAAPGSPAPRAGVGANDLAGVSIYRARGLGPCRVGECAAGHRAEAVDRVRERAAASRGRGVAAGHLVLTEHRAGRGVRRRRSCRGPDADGSPVQVQRIWPSPGEGHRAPPQILRIGWPPRARWWGHVRSADHEGIVGIGGIGRIGSVSPTEGLVSVRTQNTEGWCLRRPVRDWVYGGIQCRPCRLNFPLSGSATSLIL